MIMTVMTMTTMTVLESDNLHKIKSMCKLSDFLR